MKRIAFLILTLTASFLSSVSLAAAEDSIAVSFAVATSETGPLPTPPPVESAIAPASPSAVSTSAVSFALPEATTPRSEAPPVEVAVNFTDDAALFEGGSESIVARTVGHAEGTRSANGGKNPSYYGHVDPGNGVWNRGTFSYQFGNSENLSPEEADRRQLEKVKGHFDRAVAPKADQLGLNLSLEEKLNAIDLANQAPLAVTENGGFVERLAEAKREKKLDADKATLEARVWSFWDSRKGGWDAPGLRAYDDISKEESIRRDQDRRMQAISDALWEYRQEQSPPPSSEQKPERKPEQKQVVELPVDRLISQNVPQNFP